MADTRLLKLPRQIDALKSAHQGLELAGKVVLAELPRVFAVLESAETVMDVSIRFALDENKNRVAAGSIKAELSVVCQRCLDQMQVSVDETFHWGFTWDDEKAKALPRNLDPVLVDPETSIVDLYQAVEDELLLALPITFLHDTCEDGDKGKGKQFGELTKSEQQSQQNPFQALKGLTTNAKKTRKS